MGSTDNPGVGGKNWTTGRLLFDPDAHFCTPSGTRGTLQGLDMRDENSIVLFFDTQGTGHCVEAAFIGDVSADAFDLFGNGDGALSLSFPLFISWQVASSELRAFALLLCVFAFRRGFDWQVRQILVPHPRAGATTRCMQGQANGVPEFCGKLLTIDCPVYLVTVSLLPSPLRI